MANRVAIVTGASSGIGEALTRELVKQGWTVAMADIQRNQQLCDDLGTQARFYHTDVTDYWSQATAFSAIFKHYGRIDALCANAGIADRSSVYILDSKDSDLVPPAPDLSTTDVNFKGVIYGIQLAVHFMRKNKTPGGAIVATSSVVAMHPHPCFPEYSGTKAAVLNFTRSVADVLKEKDSIRINCVMPGVVPTKNLPPGMVEAISPEYMTPMKTVTDAYLRLLDDEFLHGQAIECSTDKQLLLEPSPMMNGDATRRAVTVWEPLFKYMHGEVSDLTDTLA